MTKENIDNKDEDEDEQLVCFEIIWILVPGMKYLINQPVDN